MEENVMAARSIQALSWDTKNKKHKTKNDDTVTALEDRISALPKELLHHILCFLDMKEVVQTSFISKRWRHTWKSLQDLTFDYSLWEESSRRKRTSIRPYVKRVFNRDECMGFVDRVLFVGRDTTTNIRKVKLSQNYCLDKLRLNTWLLFLLPTIKEIELDNTNDDSSEERYRIAFPDSLFTSKLEVFIFRSCRRSVGLPRTILCSYLRTLYLQNCHLPTGDCNGELTFNNPILETLSFIQCAHENLKVLKIIAPKLKKLVIRNPQFHKTNCNSCTMRLCTPNLLLLELIGVFYDDYALGDLSALVTAKLEQGKYMGKAFHYLHNVSTLKIFGSCQALPESELAIELSSFRKLKRLEFLCPSHIPTVTKFLQSAPSVNTLILGSFVAEIFAGDQETHWENKLQSQDMFYPVKCVQIVNIRFHENELKFLTYLLENSKALESITITYTEQALKGKKKELAKFTKKLQSLQKGSASVIDVHFLKRSAVSY